MMIAPVDVKNYNTLLFDCDGVLLNSNKVKTEAFFEVAKKYGVDFAEELVFFHLNNGGISRYRKFEHFKNIILPENNNVVVETLIEEYAKRVADGLMACGIAEGLFDLRKHARNANWLVVSGGDQAEIRRIFEARGISKLFDGGIFGSPDDKETIVERELRSGVIKEDSLFIGDSKYDRIVAQKFRFDFLFVSEWSECKKEDFSDSPSVAKISDLLR